MLLAGRDAALGTGQGAQLRYRMHNVIHLKSHAGGDFVQLLGAAFLRIVLVCGQDILKFEVQGFQKLAKRLDGKILLTFFDRVDPSLGATDQGADLDHGQTGLQSRLTETRADRLQECIVWVGHVIAQRLSEIVGHLNPLGANMVRRFTGGSR